MFYWVLCSQAVLAGKGSLIAATLTAPRRCAKNAFAAGGSGGMAKSRQYKKTGASGNVVGGPDNE
jgi:hypothetical protein